MLMDLHTEQAQILCVSGRQQPLTRNKEQRTTRVILDTSSFGTAMYQEVVFDVLHPLGTNFNAEAPRLPSPCRVAYDALWEFVEFMGEEDPAIAQLPNGWSLSVLAQYQDLGFTGPIPKIQRCVWTLPVRYPEADWSIAHPHYDRLLTDEEIAALHAGEENVKAYLERQLNFCLSGAWGAEDVALRYDRHALVWHKTPVTESCKVLDLSQYKPEVTPRFEDANLTFKRFNLTERGKTIRPWNEVAKYNTHWKLKHVDTEL